MKIIALRCPSCGAGLQVAPHLEDFACGHCGTSLRAVREGGTVSVVADAIAKVQDGTDRTAAELALVRLGKKLAAVEKELASITHEDIMSGALMRRNELQELKPLLLKQIAENEAIISRPYRSDRPYSNGIDFR